MFLLFVSNIPSRRPLNCIQTWIRSGLYNCKIHRLVFDWPKLGVCVFVDSLEVLEDRIYEPIVSPPISK
jgi:hypothetical protein